MPSLAPDHRMYAHQKIGRVDSVSGLTQRVSKRSDARSQSQCVVE